MDVTPLPFVYCWTTSQPFVFLTSVSQGATSMRTQTFEPQLHRAGCVLGPPESQIISVFFLQETETKFQPWGENSNPQPLMLF